MSRKRNDRAVIFDLGNVVLDWNVGRFLDSMNIESRQRALLRNELFEHRHWLDLDHGKVSEATVVALVCARTSLTRDVVEASLDTARQSLTPIADSVALMQEIASNGIDMFCLSNMSRETWAHVGSLPLFEMFSGSVISGIEGCMKPGEEIFRRALERFALEPSAALFIDDSPANVETARRLGLDGIHFDRSAACYGEIRSRLF